MHAMDNELNIKKMGGLHSQMKATSIIMTVASLALAGIFPLAGFYSKDLILEVAFNDHAYILWTVLWITAGLTAFYSFRLVMLVFHGEEKYKKLGFHPHEVPNYVIYAMTPLAFLAVTSGWLEHSFFEFVKGTLPGYHPHIENSTILSLIALTLGLVGLSIAFAVYKYKNGGFNKSWESTWSYKLLINQYYIPNLYNKLFVQNYKKLSAIAWSIDQKVVDATVDFIAKVVYSSGEGASKIHNGNLSSMLRLMTLGFVVILIVALILSAM